MTIKEEFREWLRESELNENIKIDLKKLESELIKELYNIVGNRPESSGIRDGDVDKHDRIFRYSTSFDDYFIKKYPTKKWIVVNSNNGNYDEDILHIRDGINNRYHGKHVIVDNEKYKAYVGGVYDSSNNTIGIIVTLH